MAQATALEVFAVGALIAGLGYGVVHAVSTPDITSITGDLLASCGAFPQAPLTVLDESGRTVGHGRVAPSYLDCTQATYAVNDIEADTTSYRFVLGELTSDLIPGPPGPRRIVELH